MERNRSSFSNYDLLPAEIHLSIIQAIDDWSTLRNLIRASPQALQLYLTARDVINLSVMRNQISNSPILTCLTKLISLLDAWFNDDPEQLLQVFEDLESGKATVYHDLSLTQVKYLLRLDRAIEYFIPDFTSTRLRVLDHFLLSKGLDIKQDSRPSLNERTRLRQAFYQREICAQLQLVFTPVCETIVKSHVTWNAATNYLQSIGSISIAEMMCVCQYIMDKALLHLDQVEDDFKQERMGFKPHFIEPDNWDNTWHNDDMFFSNEFGRDMQEEWIKDNATMPLLSFKAMLTETSPTTRLDDIRDGIYDSRGYNYLFEILKQDCESPEKTQTVSKALSWASESNCWSNTKPEGPEGLRRWAYAIWDDERTELLGVLQFNPKHVASECSGQLKERRKRPTIEDWSRKQEQIWKEQGLIDENFRSIEYENGAYFATVTGKNDVLQSPTSIPEV